VRAAVDAGASAARAAGEVQSVHVIARPHGTWEPCCRNKHRRQMNSAVIDEVSRHVHSQSHRQCCCDPEEREVLGMKLLLIQPYISRDGKLQISGSSVVAVDSVGAGAGECVLFTQGSSARLTPTTKDAP